MISQEKRPEAAQVVLGEGDLSVMREIRDDMAWCGHWERLRFTHLPIDMPDWVRRSFESPPRPERLAGDCVPGLCAGAAMTPHILSSRPARRRA
jgi:hypothetical protein